MVYYLQAGAFQKSSDADNLKARLALAGLEAQIQTATLPDNSIWHRVRLGPYSNAQELDKARSTLKDNKIDDSGDQSQRAAGQALNTMTMEKQMKR